jgi:hypothetical protein
MKTRIARLCKFIDNKRQEAPPAYLPWNSENVSNGAAIVTEISEHLEYKHQNTPEDFEADEIADEIQGMDSLDLDSWAPYCSQRSEIVRGLGGTEKNDCEDYLEGIYGKPFEGCDTLEDVEARLAWAALELAFCEVREWVLDEVLPEFFELEADASSEVTA